MAGVLAQIAGKHILKESARNRFGSEDPYFESVPATRLNGTPNGKTKKIKKRLPPGISDNDAKVLTKVRRRAYRLDLSLFNCCGVRFGWGSVIGLIPFAGDAVDLVLARMVIQTARQVDGGLPSHVVNQMYMNAVIDFVIGFIPFLGDIADAVYKCNTRNAVLLEKELRKRGQARLKGQHTTTYDPSLEDEYDRDSEEELNRHNGGPPPQYQPSEHNRQIQPSRAQPQKSGRNFFGGGSRRAPDPERAEAVDAPAPQLPTRPQATQGRQAPRR